MKKKLPISKCCKAPIRISESLPDFIGEKPSERMFGTMYYICTKCNEACDSFVKTRKTFKINPVTRVQPNKKKEFKDKLARREIRDER